MRYSILPALVLLRLLVPVHDLTRRWQGIDVGDGNELAGLRSEQAILDEAKAQGIVFFRDDEYIRRMLMAGVSDCTLAEGLRHLRAGAAVAGTPLPCLALPSRRR